MGVLRTLPQQRAYQRIAAREFAPDLAPASAFAMTSREKRRSDPSDDDVGARRRSDANVFGSDPVSPRA
jgi:hypothetical protein